jgi:hypothetical protein
MTDHSNCTHSSTRRAISACEAVVMPPVDTPATDRRYAEMYPAGPLNINKVHELMREVETFAERGEAFIKKNFPHSPEL